MNRHDRRAAVFALALFSVTIAFARDDPTGSGAGWWCDGTAPGTTCGLSGFGCCQDPGTKLWVSSSTPAYWCTESPTLTCTYANVSCTGASFKDSKCKIRADGVPNGTCAETLRTCK